MESNAVSLANLSVLLVDDIPENLTVLSKALKPDGYRFAFALNGEKALEVANHMVPDLILLDVMMPGMNGFETCRRLKSNEKTKHIPVIFITARKEEADVVEGFDMGGIDYISKPLQYNEVRARVRTHLELHVLKNRLEEKVRERTQELNDTRLEIITRLGMAAEYRDNKTGLHIKRMSHYSVLLGRAIGMKGDLCELLLHASPMHDIGKIGIPDSILLKKNKLNHDEWEIMKTHSAIGSKILSGSNHDILQLAQVIALTHQERWDGSGYPQSLKGEKIPLVGRVTALSDVFEALTSVRPYKRAWSIKDAMAEIESKSGIHFDPELVAKFKGILPNIIEVKKRFEEPG